MRSKKELAELFHDSLAVVNRTKEDDARLDIETTNDVEDGHIRFRLIKTTSVDPEKYPGDLFGAAFDTQIREFVVKINKDEILFVDGMITEYFFGRLAE